LGWFYRDKVRSGIKTAGHKITKEAGARQVLEKVSLGGSPSLCVNFGGWLTLRTRRGIKRQAANNRKHYNTGRVFVCNLYQLLEFPSVAQNVRQCPCCMRSENWSMDAISSVSLNPRMSMWSVHPKRPKLTSKSILNDTRKIEPKPVYMIKQGGLRLTEMLICS
jgi:hypothetical protein